MSELLVGKLLPPYAGTALIERTRLIKLFANSRQQAATIVAAPAGYGKTVLLTQVAALHNNPVIWYQLDVYDNDPAVFLQYLAAGLRRYFPDFGAEISRLATQGSGEANPRLLAMTFIASLERQTSGEAWIVLDDYHVITHPVIHSFVEELLRYLPADMHIVLVSRTLPPFSLARLKLSGTITLIGPEELRFRREEIEAFYRQDAAMHPSPVDIDALERLTAGWPAALRLAGLSPAGAAAALPSYNEQEIYDYLATEVFDQQQENVRSFLLATSVLENISPAFCDQLLERTDASQVLDLLEKQQLFLIPLAGEKKTYRYHHLFRSFLQARLGAGRTALLHRAGMLSWDAGDLENAVEYLAAASCYEKMPAIIKQAGNQAFARGHWQTVGRWLESLPATMLTANPWLALYQGKVEVQRGRLGEAEHYLRTATTLFTAAVEEAAVIECQLLQGQILRSRAYFVESLELLDQVLQKMPAEQKKQRFDLILERHLCLGMLGRFAEAETDLLEAIVEAQMSGNNYMLAYFFEALGNTYWALGKYSEALQTYHRAAEISPDQVLPSYYMQDFIAIIYHDWGESERALTHIKRSIAVKENLGLIGSLPSAYLQLAIIYSDQGEWAQAENYFSQAVRLIRENNGEGFYLANTLVLWAESLGQQGRWLEARAKYDQAVAEIPAQPEVEWSIWAVQVIVQTDGTEAGQRFLTRAIAELEQSGYQKGLCWAYAFQAWLYWLEEEPVLAADYAEKALKAAAKFNYQQIFISRYEPLLPVLKTGLQQGVEVQFIQRILVRIGEQALPLLNDLSGHEAPAVRRRVVTPLLEIGGPPAKEILLRLSRDPNQEVRQLALLAAQRLDSITDKPLLSGNSLAPLQAVTFGPFQTCVQGSKNNPINWRTNKTRDLFAYLIHEQEPVSREKILHDLWPDLDTGAATVIFHTTMYNLRRNLSNVGCKNLVHYSGKRYQLQAGKVLSDHRQFQELVAAGFHPETAPEKIAELLEKAVALYQGDYLENIDYLWAVPYRENLKQSYIDARLRLARYYQSRHDYPRMITHLQVVETYDPFVEEAHALLLTAYAGQRNTAAIEKHYKKVVSVFKRELGLPPSSSLQELYLKLMPLKTGSR